MTATIDSPTFDALLATVCDYPGDPVPMLVLADWMDENLGHDVGRAMRWAVEKGVFPFQEAGWRSFNGEDAERWWFWMFEGTGDLYPAGWHSVLPSGFRDHPIDPGIGMRRLCDSWCWFIDRFNAIHTPL
jgi:uncharacterized protein (TIGR02996 family)